MKKHRRKLIVYHPQLLGYLLPLNILPYAAPLHPNIILHPLLLWVFQTGSVFAITLCMIVMPGVSSMSLILYSLFGSALGAAIVYGSARLLPGGSSPLTLAILGTIIGTFLGESHKLWLLITKFTKY